MMRSFVLSRTGKNAGKAAGQTRTSKKEHVLSRHSRNASNGESEMREREKGVDRRGERDTDRVSG